MAPVATRSETPGTIPVHRTGWPSRWSEPQTARQRSSDYCDVRRRATWLALLFGSGCSVPRLSTGRLAAMAHRRRTLQAKPSGVGSLLNVYFRGKRRRKNFPCGALKLSGIAFFLSLTRPRGAAHGNSQPTRIKDRPCGYVRQCACSVATVSAHSRQTIWR